jgi:predicted ester cyclase
MNRSDLVEHYRGYIACLNQQDWPNLEAFVHNDAHYNGRLIGNTGYRAMLEDGFKAIPDLSFNIQQLIVDPPHVACRLQFDCTPTGALFDLPVNGRRVEFGENVFYEFRDGRIWSVWSVIDKVAIEAQPG